MKRIYFKVTSLTNTRQSILHPAYQKHLSGLQNLLSPLLRKRRSGSDEK